MTVSILLYSVVELSVLYVPEYEHSRDQSLIKNPLFYWLQGFIITDGDLVHLIVTYVYFKVIIELEALLDKDILMNNLEKLRRVDT